MTTLEPYIIHIIPAIVSLVLLMIIVLQGRSARKSSAALADRMEELEQRFSQVEAAARDEIRKSDESSNLKMVQLREELRTTLESFVEATGNKLAENSALQKSRIDKLAERMEALARREPPRPEQKPEPQPRPAPTRQSPAHDKAKRLARLIVSDIVLYNQAAVEEGIRNNTFAQLLAHDIQEARTLYAQRVPEEIRNGTSYLDDAFREMIARKKRELTAG